VGNCFLRILRSAGNFWPVLMEFSWPCVLFLEHIRRYLRNKEHRKIQRKLFSAGKSAGNGFNYLKKNSALECIPEQ